MVNNIITTFTATFHRLDLTFLSRCWGTCTNEVKWHFDRTLVRRASALDSLLIAKA